MSDVIYQYQQAYVPNNGNIFYFWVDCTKEIHDEEAREGGTVRTLYTAPPAPVLRWYRLCDNKPEIGQEVIIFNGLIHTGYRYTEFDDFEYDSYFTIGNATHWQPLPSPPEASNEQ